MQHVWGKRRGVYRILVRKHEGKRPHGRHRRRWDDNIQEVGCRVIDWIDLSSGYRQVAATCKCGNEPSGSIKCGEFLD
jgi:hypothetical protein